MANRNFPLEDEPDVKKPGWLSWLRGRFFAGVFVAAPIAITVVIVLWLISVIDNRVKPLIPPALNIESYTDFAIPGFGVLVAIILLTLLGAITTNLLGRSAVGFSDRLLSRIPRRSEYIFSVQATIRHDTELQPIVFQRHGFGRVSETWHLGSRLRDRADQRRD